MVSIDYCDVYNKMMFLVMQATLKETHTTPQPLYARLMGVEWSKLGEAVRQAHLVNRELRRVGLFLVQHGTSRAARALLAILSLPSAGEEVVTELVIAPFERGEVWKRRFGNRRMQTTQTERAGGVLAEQMGVVELRFRLEVKDGSLIYRQIGAALQIGPLSVPLPAWLQPCVIAREEPDGLDRIRVAVVVTAPLAGFLISYDGFIQSENRE